MTYRIVRPMAFPPLAGVVLLLIATLGIVAFREPPESWTELAANVVSALAATAVGTVVATRKPRNPAGWVLQAGGLVGALVVFDLAYAPAGLPAAAHVDWLTSMLAVPVGTGVVVVLLLTFPDGRLTAPGWRLVTRGWLAGIVLFSLGNAFRPELLEVTGFENPFAFSRTQAQPLTLDVASGVGALLIASTFAASAVACGLRFRRSRGAERQQMKWFTAATSMVVAGMVATIVFYESGHPGIANTITALALMTFPVAIGIAITRYRLYEIDRIINRTVVYAVVAALLAGLFAGGVALTSTVLPTGSSDLGIALSTLAVAGLFNPLRRRTQRLVDRRFHRTRYDPQQITDAFSLRLRDKVDPADVGTVWVNAAIDTLQPENAGMWIKDANNDGGTIGR